MSQKARVLIATPAHGYALTTMYHQTILALLAHSRDRGVEFDSRIVSVAVISVARNFLASYFLENSHYTHLLFVDADMGFAPTLVEKMLQRDVPVCGVCCPSRAFDLARMHEMSRRVNSPTLAAQLAYAWIGNSSWFVGEPEEGKKDTFRTTIVNGFVRASKCGTGVMLITRAALETIKDRCRDVWVDDCGALYRGLGLKGGVLQCFDAVRDAGGLFVGEDVSFCQRWTETCGGEIWLNLDEPISHCGHIVNTGAYLNVLRP